MGVVSAGTKSTATWANQATNRFIDDDTDTTTVTLSSTSAFSSTAFVTFTLTEQRRVRIYVICRYTLGAATAGRINAAAAYVAGSSTSTSATSVGISYTNRIDVATAGVQCCAAAEGTVLLAAGTYTAQGLWTRGAGSTSDTVTSQYVQVIDIGAL